MTPGKEAPPTAEDLKLLSDTATKNHAGRWASGWLEDGRLIVWRRHKQGPSFVFPLRGESPEISDYSPETKERSDVKWIADYALDLLKALERDEKRTAALEDLANHVRMVRAIRTGPNDGDEVLGRMFPAMNRMDESLARLDALASASVKYTVWVPMSSRLRVEGEGKSRPLTPAEKLKHPHADRMVEAVRVDNVRWRSLEEGK